jgi:hypothetical protein
MSGLSRTVDGCAVLLTMNKSAAHVCAEDEERLQVGYEFLQILL